MVLPCRFFFLARRFRPAKDQTMEHSDSTVAQQIAQAAIAFELQRTGHTPQSVTVIVNRDTLVITLRGSLSPAERVLAQTPDGAARVREFHRQLFLNSSAELGQKIQRITGAEVRES